MLGCGTAADETPTDTSAIAAQSSAVHVVSFEDGSSLEFFELDQGWVAYGGVLPAGVAPGSQQFDLSGSVVDVFQRVRPGVPVPDTLVALGARQGQRLAQEKAAARVDSNAGVERASVVDSAEDLIDQAELSDVTSPDEGPAIVPRHSFHEEFEADNCTTSVLTTANNNQRIKTVPVCLLHKTGDRTDTVSNLKQAYGAVYAYNGNITYSVYWRTTGSWVLGNSLPIASDSGHWYTVTENGSRPDVRFKITDATNNSHHRAVVTDSYLCTAGCSWDGSVCKCGT
jgi:hypothetical protein